MCVVDGVFEAVAAPLAQPVDTDAAAQANPEPDPAPAPQSVIFHAATGLDVAAIAQVQTNVRKRILRAFVARGHLKACDAKDINERAASSSHGGGFSVDAGVRIAGADRAGLERLLRYCARPPFAMDRLRQRGADLVYRCGKVHTEPLQSDKYSGELVLTPLELIERIAQLVPPPRTHRHRYYGVLAPNSPLRAAVTAMAQAEQVVASIVRSSGADVACTAAGSASGVTGVAGVPGVGAVLQPEPQAKPKPRPPSHYLWAALIARIYEVFPLLCPMCGGQMRIIAPARGPPLWDDSGAQESQEQGEGVVAEPDWDLANQSPPEYPDDQRTDWWT